MKSVKNKRGSWSQIVFLYDLVILMLKFPAKVFFSGYVFVSEYKWKLNLI